MTEQTTSVPIEAAVISDRGLSEKRPLNEDSYLSDTERRIFAVADGVGGAQAGEVASKTAVEVLDEAFRHQLDGADLEDLMEIAIQRANNSIYQMAQDSPKLSAMATTIVALHLDGRIATIGHVGDSRLYRLSPDGQLHRETADHSVVEEEVRAGRMTPEQAAHHPSRNVISRALGAEPSVEVDMKMIEIEDGTTFLLCSDGITRHIPDNEIRELLTRIPKLEDVCAEMKRRCYERGAEDNLTAVIVRVGQSAKAVPYDDEQTLISTRADLSTTIDSPLSQPQNLAQPPPDPPAAPVQTVQPSLPPPPVIERTAPPANPVLAVEPRKGKRLRGGARDILVLIVILGIGIATFYVGMYYQRQRATNEAAAAATPTPTPTPADPVIEFDKKRRDVDQAPKAAAKTMHDDMVAKGLNSPLDSNDPEFLYLYGRALMLSGDNINALAAFERASANLKDNTSPLYDRLRVESRVSALAVASMIRYLQPDAERRALQSFNELIDKGASPSPPSQ
ncbi:MAG TPA: PP2C family serine/threonine-protein phosphatase [Pyrinomonadaceae bacterium]|nr:PP2C family serine/threonine-protein phosphatase [Pyrinomonadaceae bacterium]